MNNLKFKTTTKDSKIGNTVFKHLDGSDYILD